MIIPAAPAQTVQPARLDRLAGANVRANWASRLALATLVALAASVGFGDIAQVSPPTTLLLTSVHALPLLAIGLSMVASIGARHWPRYPRELALPLAVWLAVQVGSAWMAPSYGAEAAATLERPASGALLVWAVANTCHARTSWLRVLRALALGGCVVAGIALAEASGYPLVSDWLAALQHGSVPIGDVPRAAATLSHPNETAIVLELSLPLLIAWAWTASGLWRVPLTLAGAATLGAIVVTFSRAGIVAALLALGLLGLLAVRRGEPDRARAVGLMALVVPLTLGWATLVDPGLDHRLLAGLDESSASQPPRTEFWSVALRMAHDSPLVGIGPDNFRWRFDSYSGAAADNLGIHAHNQYLEALADTGLLGLISLLWLFGTLLVRCVRSLRTAGADWLWRAALLASLGAWLTHALVDDFERFWPTSIAFWLLVGLSVSRASD